METAIPWAPKLRLRCGCRKACGSQPRSGPIVEKLPVGVCLLCSVPWPTHPQAGRQGLGLASGVGKGFRKGLIKGQVCRERLGTTTPSQGRQVQGEGCGQHGHLGEGWLH